MSEERKGTAVEAWDAVKGQAGDDTPMQDVAKDAGIEDMVEQNDNSLDGIINNLPDQESAAELAEKADEVRESVLKKLKDCVKILEDEKDKRPPVVCCEMVR